MTFPLRAASLVLALICFPLGLLADDRESYNNLKRIKLSLQKEALVLKMTHAACYAVGGLNPARKKALALDLMENYDATLTSFRDGAATIGVLPETEADVLMQIDALEAVWEEYRTAMQQVVSGDHHALIVGQMLSSYTELADASSQLAAGFIDHYGAEAVDEDLGRALRLSARQAMLSQRMIKEMCYVHFGVGGKVMAHHLRETVKAVDAGFAALMDGDATVPSPPNTRVEDNLRAAQEMWGDVRTLAQAIADGATTQDEQIAAALEQNIQVLQYLQRAKEGYLFES